MVRPMYGVSHRVRKYRGEGRTDGEKGNLQMNHFDSDVFSWSLLPPVTEIVQAIVQAMLARLVLAVVLVIGGDCVGGHDFFVDGVKGDDKTGDGTAAHPFASIQQAQQAVQRFLTQTEKLTSNVTVHIAPADYFAAEGLHFGSKDSGLDGFHVVYKGEGAGTTLYGGVKLTTKWTPVGKDKLGLASSVWATDISSIPELANRRFFMLIVGGEAAVLARSPVAGSGYLKELGCHNSDTQINCPAGVLPAGLTKEAGDASVFANLGADWFTDTRKVASITMNGDGSSVVNFEKGQQPNIDTNGIIFPYQRYLHRNNNTEQYSSGSRSSTSMGANDKVYLQGCPSLISEPGEWALDSTKRTVYYYPYPGKEPKDDGGALIGRHILCLCCCPPATFQNRSRA